MSLHAIARTEIKADTFRSHQSRIGLTIDEIRIISRQLSVHELTSSSRVHQQLIEHSNLLNSILNGQANIQNQIQLQQASIEQAHSAPVSDAAGSVRPILTKNQHHDSIIRIRARASRSQQSPCLLYCSCACHHVQVFRSANFLHNAVGAFLSPLILKVGPC